MEGSEIDNTSIPSMLPYTVKKIIVIKPLSHVLDNLKVNVGCKLVTMVLAIHLSMISLARNLTPKVKGPMSV